MKSERTLAARLDAIVRAVDFIEDRLLESPGVVEIASACGVSRTHLQRLFSEIVGQPVGAYCQRRRLCRSMEPLLATDRSILDIAIEVGFQSQAAYTRAFRSHFGVAPGTYRETSDRFSDLMEPKLTRTRLRMRLDHSLGTPRMECLGPETYVGAVAAFIWAMSDGSDVKDVVPAAWERFEAHSRGLPSGPRFSLSYPAPEDEQQRGDEMLVMTGVRVPAPPARVPTALRVKSAPASRYAVFRNPGSPDEYTQTVVYAFQDWLPESPFEYDAAGVQLRSIGQGNGPDEFWMPVVPRGEAAPWRRRQPRRKARSRLE